MKRKFILILTLLMVFAFAWPLTASASAVADARTEFPRVLQPVADSEYKVAAPGHSQPQVEFENYDETRLFLEVEEKIKVEIRNLGSGSTKTIDLTDMRIDGNKYKINRVLFSSPYLNFKNNTQEIVLTFNTYTSGMYESVVVENKGVDIDAHFKAVDRVIAEILDQVTNVKTEQQKALVIHDYFADQFEYALDASNPNAYRSAGLFLNKTGTCEAYASGYKYIMNKLGIACYVTRSEKMSHAWNIIKIKDNYYHVDCTWDDPVPNRIGQTRHMFFMVSDNTIKNSREIKYYDWDLETTFPCKDGTYDQAYWVNVKSPIALQGDTAFYIGYDKDADEGYLYRKEGENAPVRVRQLGKWKQGTYRWPGVYSGLFLYNDWVYYNTPTETPIVVSGPNKTIAQIRKVKIDGLLDQEVYTITAEDIQSVEASGDLTNVNVNLYGLRRQGGLIEYWVTKNPNESGVIRTFNGAIYEDNTIVTGIALERKIIQLSERESFSFTYVLAPATLNQEVLAANTPDKIKWTSSKPEVASIDASGTVQALTPGTTTITAATSNGKTATCEVTVTRRQAAITEIRLNTTELKLESGKSDTLIVTFIPSYTTENKSIIWTTANAGIATVENGTVKGVKPGETTITATASNGMLTTCKVTVTPVPITGVTLDKTQLSLEEGAASTLAATIAPASTSDSKTLTWTTSNEAIATVTDGTVTAKAAGSATITVKTSNGKTASCTVTVTKKTTTTPTPALAFPDLVSGAWYLNSINYVSSRGIMTGKAADRFDPEGALTREEFITILYRLEGQPAVSYKAVFPDVPNGAFFTSPAIWGYDKKISTGYANGSFGVSKPITREDLVTMMYRYTKDYLGLDTSSKGDLSKYADNPSVSLYAADAVMWAVGTGIISGKEYSNATLLDPTGLAKRSECAAIIQRFMTKYNK